MTKEKANIILKFDDESLAKFQTLLENHIASIETLLSLDGGDDSSVLKESIDKLEEQHDLATNESFKQLLSMMENIRKVILENIDGLKEVEKRLDNAANSLSEKAEETKKVIQGEKSLSDDIWRLDQLLVTKKIINNCKVLLIDVARRWASSVINLMVNAELIKPPSLQKMLKKRRNRRIGQVLAWLGLVLTLVTFSPALAIPAGIVAIIWFFLERRLFIKSELKDLKEDGRFAKEVRQVVDLAISKAKQFQIEVSPFDAKSMAELVAPILVPLESGYMPNNSELVALDIVLQEVIDNSISIAVQGND